MKIGKKIDIFTGAPDGVFSKTINDQKVITWLGSVETHEYKLIIVFFLRVLIKKKPDLNHV